MKRTVDLSAPWLVVGSDGTIGAALLSSLAGKGVPVIGTTRRAGGGARAVRITLDLATGADTRALPERIGVAFICAGISSIDACHREPETTRQINVTQTVALAQRLAERGARVVYLSSNQVFDGRTPLAGADAPVSPVSAYGKQKAEAEVLLRSLEIPAAVVRLTKVLPAGAGLLAGWRNALRNGWVVRAFDDMKMAPVPLWFVVDALERIARAGLEGVTQISGERDVTYAEAAAHLAERLEVEADLVRPMSAKASGDFSVGALPEHTAMDVGRLRRELGMVVPEVWGTIREAAGVHT